MRAALLLAALALAGCLDASKDVFACNISGGNDPMYSGAQGMGPGNPNGCQSGTHCTRLLDCDLPSGVKGDGSQEVCLDDACQQDADCAGLRRCWKKAGAAVGHCGCTLDDCEGCDLGTGLCNGGFCEATSLTITTPQGAHLWPDPNGAVLVGFTASANLHVQAGNANPCGGIDMNAGIHCAQLVGQIDHGGVDGGCSPNGGPYGIPTTPADKGSTTGNAGLSLYNCGPPPPGTYGVRLFLLRDGSCVFDSAHPNACFVRAADGGVLSAAVTICVPDSADGGC